jgi:hypothetical protein
MNIREKNVLPARTVARPNAPVSHASAEVGIEIEVVDIVGSFSFSTFFDAERAHWLRKRSSGGKES